MPHMAGHLPSNQLIFDSTRSRSLVSKILAKNINFSEFHSSKHFCFSFDTTSCTGSANQNAGGDSPSGILSLRSLSKEGSHNAMAQCHLHLNVWTFSENDTHLAWSLFNVRDVTWPLLYGQVVQGSQIDGPSTLPVWLWSTKSHMSKGLLHGLIFYCEG